MISPLHMRFGSRFYIHPCDPGDLYINVLKVYLNSWCDSYRPSCVFENPFPGGILVTRIVLNVPCMDKILIIH